MATVIPSMMKMGHNSSTAREDEVCMVTALTIHPFCRLKAQSRYFKVCCVVFVPSVAPNGHGMT